jgi:hypothetical protein
MRETAEIATGRREGRAKKPCGRFVPQTAFWTILALLAAFRISKLQIMQGASRVRLPPPPPLKPLVIKDFIEVIALKRAHILPQARNLDGFSIHLRDLVSILRYF